MKDFVTFSQPWGGLGDNLAYSNLPRLYSEINIKFYISHLNFIRNKEIEKLVWLTNPYVENAKKLYPTVGYIKSQNYNFQVFDNKFNAIQNINHLHGFNPGKGYPEIFIDFNKLLKKKKYPIVLDLNGLTINNLDFEYIPEAFNKKLISYPSKFTTELVYPNLYNHQKYDLNNQKLIIKSLTELIMTILNTDTFVCLNSGSHVLAAALKHKTGFPNKIISFNSVGNPEIEIENNKILNKNGKYYFDNVFYEYVNIQKKSETLSTVKYFKLSSIFKFDQNKSIFLHKFYSNPTKTFKLYFLKYFFLILKNFRRIFSKTI